MAASLQLNLKKNGVRNAILTLATEWNSLDEQLEKSLAETKTELENLEANRASMVESKKELDSVREWLTTQLKELEYENEKFRLFKESRMDELEKKSEQLSGIRMAIRKEIEEVELKEKGLNEQRKSIEGLLEKFDKEKQEFLDIKKANDGKLNEIVLKERNFEDRSKELDLKEEQLRLKEEQMKLVSKKRKKLSGDDSLTPTPFTFFSSKSTHSRFEQGIFPEIYDDDLTSNDFHMELPPILREWLKNSRLKINYDLLEKKSVEELWHSGMKDMLEGLSAISEIENCVTRVLRDVEMNQMKLEAVNKDLLCKLDETKGKIQQLEGSLEAEKKTSFKQGFEAAVEKCLMKMKAIGDEKTD